MSAQRKTLFDMKICFSEQTGIENLLLEKSEQPLDLLEDLP